MAQEVIHRGHTQGRQKAPVAFIDPDDATRAVGQEHALAHAGKQMEHGARCQRQDAVGIEWQAVGHGAGSKLGVIARQGRLRHEGDGNA
ncbi:hypothetical protein D3C71_2026160 [compost metagenome]